MQHYVVSETLTPTLAVPPRGAADAATRSAFEASSELWRESARFMSVRLQRYADLQAALMRNPNPIGSWACFAEFSRLTMEDYAKEMQAVPAMFGDISENTLLNLETGSATHVAPVLD